MGNGEKISPIPDLFSAASAQETASPAPKPITSARHVLPSDLPSAVKHLNDQELEQLLAAVVAEQVQRGGKPQLQGKGVKTLRTVPP